MINELILWIADLPNIVRVMFLGAVLGGIGGVLGAAMRRYWPLAGILLPVAFASVTIPINNSIMTPFLMPLAFKASFMKGAGDLPKRIDEITIAESAGIYDDAMNFTYQLETDIADMDAGRTTIKEALVSSDCR
jgi:hypothetical protein